MMSRGKLWADSRGGRCVRGVCRQVSTRATQESDTAGQEQMSVTTESHTCGLCHSYRSMQVPLPSLQQLVALTQHSQH